MLRSPPTKFRSQYSIWFLLGIALLLVATAPAVAQTVVVAEGERFLPQPVKPGAKPGWQVLHQDQTYATQTFGGMWVTHGSLLGAAADVADAVATTKVNIPQAG